MPYTATFSLSYLLWRVIFNRCDGIAADDKRMFKTILCVQCKLAYDVIIKNTFHGIRNISSPQRNVYVTRAVPLDQGSI